MDKSTKDFIVWLHKARNKASGPKPKGWTWYGVVNFAMFDTGNDYWATSCDKFDFIDWCNAPGRTQSEVIAMFDNSIRALGGRP